MARPLSFDRDRVVDDAMRTFWRHGLHATSADDLCRATGLGRGSLYNTFGGKDALFAECLAAYLERTRAQGEELLSDSALDVPTRISTLLTRLVAEEVERRADDAPLGCLGVNTIAELSNDPEHTDLVDMINEDTATRLRSLTAVLRLGQAAGEITDQVGAEGLATFVNAAIAGLRISSQRGASRQALVDIVTSTVRALRA
ncbi:TetR family transcriptional regulator [Stackebrandtia endophytica]|uniref:TetR family transcriptional regulator n=1 Tax=Stackebrandtia endophytica TaxID=1496996 RepID=A0A543AUH8_9ACTN|nr:TetR/AcrR family transcriptional regulator [Stackebrandtia endophytica]TQL76238.1 TetR family transcriptional regulator [Stackebrandtia endophytica]